MIDTKQVQNRRKLRFESFDELLAEVSSLAAAEREGKIRRLGNWELGSAVGHLAFWASAPFDGYPQMQRPPWFIRLAAPLMRKSVLNRGMPAGIRIRGVEDGTFGVSPMPTEEAAAWLRQSLERLERQAPTGKNPFFGRMTHDDWKKLNLRHGELHLGFFQRA
jgi:hypothetical protein